MTENGRISYNDLNGGLGKGCGPTLMTYCIIAFILIALCGCRSTKYMESNNESHRMTELFDRMDSLFRYTSTWQQDIYSKQSSLVDSFRQNEKRDSSHTVVLNEKGDTVRERIVIYHEVEKDHSSEKEESEMWMHRFERVDSMLQMSIEKQERTDSLLSEYKKIAEKQPTFKERIILEYGGYAILIVFILIILGFCLFIKKILPRWQQHN